MHRLFDVGLTHEAFGDLRHTEANVAALAGPLHDVDVAVPARPGAAS